jgi:hypothetical protein
MQELADIVSKMGWPEVYSTLGGALVGAIHAGIDIAQDRDSALAPTASAVAVGAGLLSPNPSTDVPMTVANSALATAAYLGTYSLVTALYYR